MALFAAMGPTRPAHSTLGTLMAFPHSAWRFSVSVCARAGRINSRAESFEKSWHPGIVKTYGDWGSWGITTDIGRRGQ